MYKNFLGKRFYVGFLLLLVLIVGSNACFIPIQCRELHDIGDDLNWFPGNEGDTISLTNQHNDWLEFTIEFKIVIHTTGYVSDTGGCCADAWGIGMREDSSGNALVYSFEEDYVYDNPPERWDLVSVEINGKFTRFGPGQMSILEQVNFGPRNYLSVKRFQYGANSDAPIRSLYIAKRYGPIMIEEKDGTCWYSALANPFAPTSIETFSLSNYKDETSWF